MTRFRVVGANFGVYVMGDLSGFIIGSRVIAGATIASYYICCSSVLSCQRRIALLYRGFAPLYWVGFLFVCQRSLATVLAS